MTHLCTVYKMIYVLQIFQGNWMLLLLVGSFSHIALRFIILFDNTSGKQKLMFVTLHDVHNVTLHEGDKDSIVKIYLKSIEE